MKSTIITWFIRNEKLAQIHKTLNPTTKSLLELC